MKKLKLFICAALMAVVPSAVMAQDAIEKIFQEIEKGKTGDKYSVSDSRNTSNGVETKTTMLDIQADDYSDLFDRIKDAFQSEREKAFFEWSSYAPISKNNTRPRFRIQRGVGDDIIVGQEKNSSMVIMSFEDPDNSDCRTVYAAEWWTTDDPSVRQGRFVRSYGPKPKQQTTVSRSYSFHIPEGMNADSLMATYRLIPDSLMAQAMGQIDSLKTDFQKEYWDESGNFKGQLNGNAFSGFPDDSFFFGKKFSNVPAEDDINSWVINAQKRMTKLSPSDWLRLFGLLTEKISYVKDDDPRELIVTAGVVLDLCKNAPSKLDEDERVLCVKRLQSIAKPMEKKNEYVFDILMLAAQKIAN